MECIDVAALAAQIDAVLARTADDARARAAGLRGVIEHVRILEHIARSRMMRKNHLREHGYDPRNDALAVRAAIAVRQHLRARGVHVTVLNFEVPESQFAPSFAEPDDEASTDAAILESLTQYL